MFDETTGPAGRRQVPAVTRAIAILRFLSRSSGPIGVNPLARELGIVPSTCLHILRVLQDEGLVDFDAETKRYTIGVGILPLARAVLQKNSFASLVQPRLSVLSQEFRVTGIATQVTEPAQMVVTALSQSNMPFRLQVDLGSRFPALISATGRLFAAHNTISESRLKAGFERLVWDHPPDFGEWMAQIEEARALGYAVDQGNYISGVTVIAVPVFAPDGRMAGSLVAIGITERLKDGKVPELARAMQDIRDELRDIQNAEGR